MCAILIGFCPQSTVNAIGTCQNWEQQNYSTTPSSSFVAEPYKWTSTKKGKLFSPTDTVDTNEFMQL